MRLRHPGAKVCRPKAPRFGRRQCRAPSTPSEHFDRQPSSSKPLAVRFAIAATALHRFDRAGWSSAADVDRWKVENLGDGAEAAAFGPPAP